MITRSILMGLLLWPLAMAGQEGPIKVMTYNILTGFDWGKDTARQTRLATWVADQAPDVVALQELCDFTPDKLAQLAQAWGHPYSVLLKEDGYPVGLTSSQPIEGVERTRDGLWHGMLHGKTQGIHFYVVHLSPADWQFRQKEAEIIVKEIQRRQNEGDRYIVLGDFNAHSPFDGDFDLKYPYKTERTRQSDEKNEKYQNLRDGQVDYSVVAQFLALPLSDVCYPYVPMDNRSTFPAPINVPRWLTAEEMEKTKCRIDFILVSPSLESQCVKASIHNQADTHYLSDHFPVTATFQW